MFEGIDLNNLSPVTITFVLILILLHNFGFFKMLGNVFIKLYNDIKQSDNKSSPPAPQKNGNGGITIAGKSLDIIRESQQLVLLDIPHKLDEAIDEMHDVAREVKAVGECMKDIAEEIKKQRKENL